MSYCSPTIVKGVTLVYGSEATPVSVSTFAEVVQCGHGARDVVFTTQPVMADGHFPTVLSNHGETVATTPIQKIVSDFSVMFSEEHYYKHTVYVVPESEISFSYRILPGNSMPDQRLLLVTAHNSQIVPIVSAARHMDNILTSQPSIPETILFMLRDGVYFNPAAGEPTALSNKISVPDNCAPVFGLCL